MTVANNRYLLGKGIRYRNTVTKDVVCVPPAGVVNAIKRANDYLNTLHHLFKQLDFDIFEGLGQRNLSGFIGEVFTVSFAKETTEQFTRNPHPDGRPDLLDISTSRARSHLRNDCFSTSNNGERHPERGRLAPFMFGGLEVKCTIGNPKGGYKRKLFDSTGHHSFQIGMARVEYLQSITFWAHHRECNNLLGLYYDYPSTNDGVPQIMLVVHAELDPATDWHEVSVGKPGSKKTSNTSLTPSGKEALKRGVVAVIADVNYTRRLSALGYQVPLLSDCG